MDPIPIHIAYKEVDPEQLLIYAPEAIYWEGFGTIKPTARQGARSETSQYPFSSPVLSGLLYLRAMLPKSV